MDWENEVSKIFIIPLISMGPGMISIHTEWLKISDAPRKQNESIWNHGQVTLTSLASFYT